MNIATWGNSALCLCASSYPQLGSSFRSAAQWCLHSRTHKLTYSTVLTHASSEESHINTYSLSSLQCTCTEVPVCGITGGETIRVPRANCVYPGWRRRPLAGSPQSTSEPPLAPASVYLDIVDYFQPWSDAVSCV